MKDTQVSKPVLILLLVAVLGAGYYFFFMSGSDEEPAPAPPVAAAPTGATGGSTAEAGATGPTGETKKKSAEELRAERRRQARAELVAAAEAAGMPLNVYQALEDDRPVMIFFWNKDAQTDQHVNQAVNEVAAKQGKELLVVKEPISNKSRYQGIAKVTEITRTPGIVMLYGKTADAWQGYIDGVALNARLEHILDKG